MGAATIETCPAVEPVKCPDLIELATEAGRAREQEFEAQRRAMVEDPDQRAKALREFRRNTARELEGIDRRLGLTQEEYNRLLDMLGEQYLRQIEVEVHCRQTPGCSYRAAYEAQEHLDRRELTNLLGKDGIRRFDEFRDNRDERRVVTDFRGELPDALRLSDTQAEQLADVLGEERRRTLAEWAQRGATPMGWTRGMFGTLYIPDTAQGVEQKVAAASEIQRRQRERAAQVLKPGQLEAFTRLQRETLEAAQGMWEEDERRAASRSSP